MSRSGVRLIQAAREAAAMARGEAVAGAVIHPAPSEVTGANPPPGPGAIPVQDPGSDRA
jgi:hypothetical protein